MQNRIGDWFIVSKSSNDYLCGYVHIWKLSMPNVWATGDQTGADKMTCGKMGSVGCK